MTIIVVPKWLAVMFIINLGLWSVVKADDIWDRWQTDRLLEAHEKAE